jgi:probable O-glycosylation ligase (exosortase A-associated)
LGILMLAWLGYMNPHRQAWGFMFNMPSVFIVAIVTLAAMLASKEAKRMVWRVEIVVLIIFILWVCLTTTQARFPGPAIEQLDKVLKIQILTFMTLLMLTSRDRVHLFIWVVVVSLGFYGVKGGIFTIVHGGVHRVQGPSGSFIAGNNELALALVMTIPLMRYLQLQEANWWIRQGLGLAMLLTALAAVGSQSRGALVALGITAVMFWLKSRRKIATAVLIAVPAFLTVLIMPAEWFERMQTIKTYEQDASAQGRLRAWTNAINMANSRVLGYGFEGFIGGTDAHSIYFEVLGEHGWIGLGLFVSLLLLKWLRCRSIIRLAKKRPDALWARDLAAMMQVTLVGYMSAGAFLGLAYFDYLYHLAAVAAVTHHLVSTTTAEELPVPKPPGRLSLVMAWRHA